MRVRQTVAPAVATGVVHPRDRELNQFLRQATMQLNNSHCPNHTMKQFDNKVLEYFDFCDKVYPYDTYRHILAADKIYRFMWFQCFIEKKNRGGHQSCTDNWCKIQSRRISSIVGAVPTRTWCADESSGLPCAQTTNRILDICNLQGPLSEIIQSSSL